MCHGAWPLWEKGKPKGGLPVRAPAEDFHTAAGLVYMAWYSYLKYGKLRCKEV